MKKIWNGLFLLSVLALVLLSISSNRVLAGGEWQMRFEEIKNNPSSREVMRAIRFAYQLFLAREPVAGDNHEQWVVEVASGKLDLWSAVTQIATSDEAIKLRNKGLGKGGEQAVHKMYGDLLGRADGGDTDPARQGWVNMANREGLHGIITVMKHIYNSREARRHRMEIAITEGRLPNAGVIKGHHPVSVVGNHLHLGALIADTTKAQALGERILSALRKPSPKFAQGIGVTAKGARQIIGKSLGPLIAFDLNYNIDIALECDELFKAAKQEFEKEMEQVNLLLTRIGRPILIQNFNNLVVDKKLFIEIYRTLDEEITSSSEWSKPGFAKKAWDSAKASTPIFPVLPFFKEYFHNTSAEKECVKGIMYAKLIEELRGFQAPLYNTANQVQKENHNALVEKASANGLYCVAKIACSSDKDKPLFVYLPISVSSDEQQRTNFYNDLFKGYTKSWTEVNNEMYGKLIKEKNVNSVAGTITPPGYCPSIFEAKKISDLKEEATSKNKQAGRNAITHAQYEAINKACPNSTQFMFTSIPELALIETDPGESELFGFSKSVIEVYGKMEYLLASNARGIKNYQFIGLHGAWKEKNGNYLPTLPQPVLKPHMRHRFDVEHTPPSMRAK